MTDYVMMKCGCAGQAMLTSRNGVPVDPPIPACVAHDCYEIAETSPDLTGRIAKCAYRNCKGNPRASTHYGEYGPDGRSQAPSSLDLPFFEFQGEGSRRATELCKCGYHKDAHAKGSDRKCKQFVPAGPQPFDEFYCGCHGWD